MKTKRTMSERDLIYGVCGFAMSAFAWVGLSAAMAAPPGPEQYEDPCPMATTEGLDDRVNRLEDLIWALHASEDRKRSALSDAGVAKALNAMRGEARARQGCYMVDQ